MQEKIFSSKNFYRWDKFFMLFGSLCNLLQGKIENNEEEIERIARIAAKIVDSRLEECLNDEEELGIKPL